MSSYFSRIKQYSWIVLACALIATVLGFALSRAQPTVYQASSILVVQAGAPDTTYPGGPAPGVTSADNLGIALNYAAEIPTRSVMQYVVKFDPELHKHRYTADDLMLDVTATTSTTAATISLLATATHPADAVLLANDVAKGFADYIRALNQQHLDALRNNLQSQINKYQQQKGNLERAIAALPNNTVPQYTVDNNNLMDVTRILDALQTQLQALPTTVNGDVSVAQLATPKDVTATAKGLAITAATAGVGLLVGILIMLLVIFLDNRLRNGEEVEGKLGLAYLGGLSSNNELKETPIRPTGSVAHELSDICVNLRLTGVLPGQRRAPQGAVLLVTSPQVAEGKTTLAAALATTVARGGGTVVVIDGNLRQPSTHLTFGVSSVGMGVNGLLKGTGVVDDAVVRSSTPGVWLLPAGAPMEDATLLIEQRLPGILKQLRNKTDLAIIDGPALLSSADASLLATMADGVALVIDARHEKLRLLLRARELLNSLTHTPAGIVMNHIAPRPGALYYASAYPGNALSERWVAVQAHADNGSGQKLEPMPASSGTLPASSSQVVPPELPKASLLMLPTVFSPPAAPLRVDMNPQPPLHPGKAE